MENVRILPLCHFLWPDNTTNSFWSILATCTPAETVFENPEHFPFVTCTPAWRQSGVANFFKPHKQTKKKKSSHLSCISLPRTLVIEPSKPHNEISSGVSIILRFLDSRAGFFQIFWDSTKAVCFSFFFSSFFFFFFFFLFFFFLKRNKEIETRDQACKERRVKTTATILIWKE